MIIRQERPEDYDTVYHVVKEAFENAEYTDGNEQNLVAALRKSKSFIPASECGIKAPFEVDDESFMALNFNGSQNKLNGVIEYDKAFGI